MIKRRHIFNTLSDEIIINPVEREISGIEGISMITVIGKNREHAVVSGDITKLEPFNPVRHRASDGRDRTEAAWSGRETIGPI